MSTSIQVYPASPHMPLVEETRARTQELYQDLLDRHGVGSTIEVTALLPRKTEEPVRHAPTDLRWSPGLHLAFGYLINGDWDSTSWPSCSERDVNDVIEEEDLRSDRRPHGAPPELLGEWWIAEELVGVVTPERLARILMSDHYWDDERFTGSPAVSATGYGLVAGALAEATDGAIVSIDGAFGLEHNGETAEEFLAWWGDQKINRCGVDSFRAARKPR